MFSKISLVLIFILTASFLQAQKGSWYVGGQVGFNVRSAKNTGFADVNSSTWSIAPEVGTFLQKNLQLGFALNLGGNHTDASGSSVSNFGLNVNSLGPVFNVGLYWTFKE